MEMELALLEGEHIHESSMLRLEQSKLDNLEAVSFFFNFSKLGTCDNVYIYLFITR